jgi:DNA-binding SARP family transcriptional activator/tetratricopeptide (TPR) repeat protein
MPSGETVRVRLLGPVDVVEGETIRPVSGLRRKAILATLALHAGEVVSTDRLTDIVWGENPPPTAVNTLQSHVSHLRSVLGSKSVIRGTSPGYVLAADEADTDVSAAEQLLRTASTAADPAHAVGHLRAALALWRGQPLADVTGIGWLESQAERLDLLGTRIRRALTEARLAAGDHVRLVPDLEELVADNPLDERAVGHLMLALYRSGRQADALAVFLRLRATLNDELGIDPGQELRDLETDILRQEARLDLVPASGIATVRRTAAELDREPAHGVPPRDLAAAAVPAGSSLPVPAQLPPVTTEFVGRAGELAVLDGLPSSGHAAGSGSAGAVAVAITGTAGVGKTALAVHWAHRSRHLFPDGQLYVNLRGFDPSCPPAEPAAVLRDFLEALNVPPHRIPDSTDAMAALFRSVVAGRRLLVLIDNARDTEQALPLLPGGSGSLALVTSRVQLTGLIAAGARQLSLDLLTVTEASDLLASRLGEVRVTAERQAAEEIIARCARLPLALTIAAARAAARSSFPLAAIAAGLREAPSTLDNLDGGEVGADIRAVFACSCQALTAGAGWLFRAIGLYPGTDISLAAAASLAGLPRDRTRILLDELGRAHLLTEQSPGRYAIHDLLRGYAAEQAGFHDSRQARDGAVRRLLDHFLHSAHAAMRLFESSLDVFTPSPAQPVVSTAELSTACEADEWFAAQYPALMAAVRMAADAGLATVAWQLAWIMTGFQLRKGYWDDHATAQRLGLDAARRASDAVGEAHAVLATGLGYARAGRDDDARAALRQALIQLQRLGTHPLSEAAAHRGLCWLDERANRPAPALGHAQRARELHMAAGDKRSQASTLNDVGYLYAVNGDYERAVECCEQALAELREFGDQEAEACTWHSLGFIYRGLRDYQRAIACYVRSLELTRDLADLFNEADTLCSLGDVYHEAGDVAAARQSWRYALLIFDEIGHPDAEQVRDKLRSFHGSGLPIVPVSLPDAGVKLGRVS